MFKLGLRASRLGYHLLGKHIAPPFERHLSINENEKKATQNLWNTEKAVLREKFIVLQAYLRKQTNKKAQINDLTLHLKELEKAKPKVSRKKEIIKIRAE